MKTLILAITLVTGLTACGGDDENDNGNSDETQLFCDCMNEPEKSEECKEFAKKLNEEFMAADKEGKDALVHEWKKKQAMCK